jgi:hypothetical protein
MLAAGVTKEVTLTGLTASTSYDLYLVPSQMAGGFTLAQAFVTKLEVRACQRLKVYTNPTAIYCLNEENRAKLSKIGLTSAILGCMAE